MKIKITFDTGKYGEYFPKWVKGHASSRLKCNFDLYPDADSHGRLNNVTVDKIEILTSDTKNIFES